MSDGIPEDDIARLRIALARIARRVDRQVSGDGLTRTQLSVLGTVVRLGPIGATELADIEGVNPTMLSRVIGKLEAAGYLTRTAAEHDRRAVLVHATDSGQHLQRRLRGERTALFAERLGQLADRDQQALVRALPGLEHLAEAMLRPETATAGAAR